MSKVVRRHSRLLLVILSLVALTAIPAITIASHSWGGYHWARTSNPFTLKVGDNVNSTWDSYLDTAISDWTASSVLNLTKVTGQSNNNCRPTAGRIEVCNRTYGNNGWLGLAQIWITGSVHITQGTSKMNDTYFNQAQYNTPAWRRLVMCQEIAHDFGLDHQDENFNNGNLGSCMDYTSDPDGPPSNEHPNSHDFTQLESIYAHLDSTTTVGTAVAGTVPPGMRQLVLDGIDQWGPIVKVVKNGPGLATYHVADFGRGNKIVTHVFWALDHKHHGH